MKTNFSKNQFTLVLENKEIVRVSITAKGDYNYADITINPGGNSKDYCSINYSWSGTDYLPSFITELFSFVKTTTSNKDKSSMDDGVIYINEEEYAKYKEIIGG